MVLCTDSNHATRIIVLPTQAESNKAKLQELQKSDPEKAKELLAKQKQRKAMEMAMGVKQTDDATLLKKTIKRKEKMKQKSKKAWCVASRAICAVVGFCGALSACFRDGAQMRFSVSPMMCALHRV